jgi:crotonobetainyl-CoA:carnitine CoA-transferase CaiB-like acyl-CoA transferase
MWLCYIWGAMREAILDELLVIDTSNGAAGGYCCLLFRYLGAEVVRVDRRGRTKVLPYMGLQPAASFLHLSAGKKSVTLDASQPEGAALLLRLAERADVLISDASLPAGLDYPALSRQNPRLVLTRVTVPPSDNDDLFAEYFAGLNAFTATLLPLVNMAILGRGQQVEVDGEECLAAAAFVVDGQGQWPHLDRDEAFPPPPFKVTGLAPLSPAPRPGEHNDEVYCGLLGLSGEELARLKEASVV